MSPKKKVLVIDDFEPLLEEIIDFLNMEGYKGIAAKDGAEGIQAAIEHLPDLIICDVQMPKINGYNVYTTLEKIPETASIPFVFLTALTQVEDFRKGLQLGADDYLTKPFELESLLSTINKRLEKYERYANINKDKLDALLANPLVGSFIFQKDKLIFTNPKFIEITSYTKKELNEAHIKSLLIAEPENLVSDFNLCLSGVRDVFRHKVSFVKKDKQAAFVEIFGKHVLIQGEQAIVGSLIELEMNNSKQPESVELNQIVEFLRHSGKETVVSEIENAQNLVGFESDQDLSKNRVKLSKREIEVLELICEGYTNIQIAEKLFISNRTVDNHRANLLQKTGTSNTASLVVYAVKNKLVDL